MAFGSIAAGYAAGAIRDAYQVVVIGCTGGDKQQFSHRAPAPFEKAIKKASIPARDESFASMVPPKWPPVGRLPLKTTVTESPGVLTDASAPGLEVVFDCLYPKVLSAGGTFSL